MRDGEARSARLFEFDEPGNRRSARRDPVGYERRRLPLRHEHVDGLPGLERTVLPFERDSLQRVAHVTMGIGQLQVDAASAQRLVQVGDELGACEVELGNGAQ